MQRLRRLRLAAATVLGDVAGWSSRRLRRGGGSVISGRVIETILRALEKELDRADGELDEAIQSSPVWRAKDELLQSIPGIGPVVSRTLLADMPDGERRASWHLVSPAGEVNSAGAAFAPLFRLLPGAMPLAAAASRFPRGTDRVYRWVAGNRSRWGRFVTDGAKRRADERIAARS